MAPPAVSIARPRAMSQPFQYGAPVIATGIGGSVLGPTWKIEPMLASPAGHSTSTSSGAGGSCTIHGWPPANAYALEQ